MKRPRHLIVIIALTATAIAGAMMFVLQFVPLLPFRAVDVDPAGFDAWTTRSEPLGEAERQRLIAVLTQYNEHHRVTGEGEVRITLSLFLDRDLRWNYTSKAMIEVSEPP